jgi:serine incorporator 1/3
MIAGITTGMSSCAATCCTMCACETCKCVSSSIGRKAARFIYCLLFLFSMITAWILRDHGKDLISKIPGIEYYEKLDSSIITKIGNKWYGVQAVSRISLGSFLYFGVLGILTIGIKKQSDFRDQIQNKFWIFKFLLWLVFNIFPFFVSNNITDPYINISRIGSGLFLFIQAIIFLDFLYILNSKLLEMENSKGKIVLCGLTILSYTGSIILNCFLYNWFSLADCSLNNFLITFNIIVSIFLNLMSIHPRIEHGSLFPSSIITLYNAYLTYTALISEPPNYICNGYSKKFDSNDTNFSFYLGTLTTIFALIYSAFRTGSTTETVSLNKEEIIYSDKKIISNENLIETGQTKNDKKISDDKEITYNYSFFHLIFSLAGMYMAMLYTGWGSNDVNNIGIGWANVWVKIITSWLISILYLWTLVAPLVLPNREF